MISLSTYYPNNYPLVELGASKPFVLTGINPLTSKSDYHLVFPNNVTPESHIKVTTIKDMITN